jgi:hypothetical protein
MLDVPIVVARRRRLFRKPGRTHPRSRPLGPLSRFNLVKSEIPVKTRRGFWPTFPSKG